MTAARRAPFVRALAAAVLMSGLAGVASGPLVEGWLGVTLSDAPGLTRGGARVLTVVSDSPASTAGLITGDVVLRAGGRRIDRARALTQIVRRRRPGAPLTLVYARDGAEQTIETRLAARPSGIHRALEGDRDGWQEPQRILGFLGVTPGKTVADVGAGGGYFTARLADAVGSAGEVVAVEIDPDALRTLRERFRTVAQVTIRAGTARDPGLEVGSLDAALLVDTFHELTDADLVLRALRRALRPRARLVVVDRAPASGDDDGHTIAEARVVEQIVAAGFHVRERHDLARQFALVFDADPPDLGP